MEKDRDYTALCQIERRMQNELSTFSASNTRLLEYIESMSSANTQLNGTLKALQCLACNDQKQKNPRSADCVYAWMNALLQAKKQPTLAMLFRSVDFTLPIQEEFEPIENRQTTRIAKERSRIAWFVILSLALLFGAWMALSVFILHADFYWMLMICLILYVIILAYYFWWWDRKHYIYRLKQLTDMMSFDSKRFVRSLDVQNLYWRPDLISIQQMIKVTMYPEQLENLKDHADSNRMHIDFVQDVQDQGNAIQKQRAQQRVQKQQKTSTKEMVQDRIVETVQETEQKLVQETTREFKPLTKEADPIDSMPFVQPVKKKTERKAAPNRKRTGHAARPVIRMSDSKTIHFSDLDSRADQQNRSDRDSL